MRVRAEGQKLGQTEDAQTKLLPLARLPLYLLSLAQTIASDSELPPEWLDQIEHNDK
jgi:hypothetical protein